MGRTTKKVKPAFVVVLETSNIVWGVFSSQKKALKAVENLLDPWVLRTYELDYRLKNPLPKYVSDKKDVPNLDQRSGE